MFRLSLDDPESSEDSILTSVDSPWPGSSRPSTSCLTRIEDVGARNKSGHGVMVCGSRAVMGEDDRRDEGPGLDKARLLGLPAERLHRAQQAKPVQDFVLARILDLLGRIAVPGRVVAGFECAVEPAVGLDIGPELPVLLGQERMRPGRR